MYQTIFYLLAATLLVTCARAQGDGHMPGEFNQHMTYYNNGIYDKENIGGRQPVRYPPLREADVAWEKRIWRDIDMREKQNLPLYFPTENVENRASLFQTLTRHILKGDITAFADEDFLMPYEPAIIRNKLVACDSVPVIEYLPDGTEVPHNEYVCDSTSINRQILKFRLKEDWFFDKQRSVLDVRIIGIAAYQYDEEKEGYKELFWVYFPACRPYFAGSDIYNVKNDAERRSLDDIFWKRQFSSTIVKESNVYDRYISEYQRGVDALLESDRVKNDIFKWEHDLWHF